MNKREQRLLKRQTNGQAIDHLFNLSLDDLSSSNSGKIVDPPAKRPSCAEIARALKAEYEATSQVILTRLTECTSCGLRTISTEGLFLVQRRLRDNLFEMIPATERRPRLPLYQKQETRKVTLCHMCCLSQLTSDLTDVTALQALQVLSALQTTLSFPQSSTHSLTQLVESLSSAKSSPLSDLRETMEQSTSSQSGVPAAPEFFS